MKRLTKEQLSFLLQFPTGHRLQVGALSYIEKHKIQDINILFEATKATQNIIGVFNKKLEVLDEKKRKQCTIYPTDSANNIRKKCKRAYAWGVHYAPVWNRYVQPEPTTPDTSTDGGDTGADVGGDAGGVAERKGLAGSRFTYPMSSGPDDDYQLKPQDEAMSSTERMRRFNKRHPEKVRKYLKKTQNDRVARNRDRRKAVKKHGKSKMKNHDVHHPKGPNGGSWRLAKKDHGPDKKHESLVLTGMLLLEAAPGSHVMHPYDDPNMKFSEYKDIVHQATAGDFGNEATEKYDGQTLLFTVKDGQVRFARNTQHTKNYGEGTMTADEYEQYFSGHGDKISKVFAKAARDVDSAISKIPKDKLEAIFGKGDKFVLSELLSTDLPNTVPYASDRVVMLNIRRYDPATGNPDNAPIDRFAADKVVELIKKHSDPDAGQFKIMGNTKLKFDTPDQAKFDKKEQEYMQAISAMQQEAGVSDADTLGDYFAKKWNDLLDSTGLEWTPQERTALQNRWVNGDKSFGSKDIQDTQKKIAFREIEANFKAHTAAMVEPLKSVMLSAGTDAVNRSSNIVSKNDGTREKLIATLGKAVTAVKASGNAEYIKKTKDQLNQLKKLGPDAIIPSEGLIIQRNGRLYKLTGSFTPVNQVVGLYTYKLNPSRDEPDATTEPVKAKPTKSTQAKQQAAPPQAKKKAVMPTDKREKFKGMLNARITNPDTGNQILVKTALKYDPAHPAHVAAKSLVQKNLVKEGMLLLEGGNAVAANSKIPNRFADATTKFASKALGLDKLEKQLVGTTEKPVMGDLDVAVDMEDIRNLAGYHGTDNKELFAKLKPMFADKGLEITYTPGFQQFSVLSPLVDADGNPQKAYDKDGKVTGEEGKVQVDFMMGNLPWMKRWLTNGSTSKYSSTFRNILVIDTFGSMIFDTEVPDVKWKYQINAKSGLERIEFKELPNGKKQVLKKELVSTDVDAIAKILLGEKAKFADMDTFEKFNDIVKNPNSPMKDLAPKIYDRFIKSLKNFDKDVPVEVPGEREAPAEPAKKAPIAIYSGRFQPYHAGHHVTYQAMVEKFGKDNVYVVTSDKTNASDSPFSFKDKQETMTTMFDIPADKIVQVKNTYNPQELLSKFPDSTPAVFAVGEKDADRLSGGKYFSMYDEDEPMKGHAAGGYVWVGPPPNIEINGRTISGTELRSIMGNPNITDEVKEEIFVKVYGKFDPTIFKKIVNTTAESERAIKLTKKHSEKKPPKTKAVAAAAKDVTKDKAVDTSEPKDPSFYKPGETWQTTSGKFGAKNKRNKIMYFSAQDRAQLFANK